MSPAGNKLHTGSSQVSEWLSKWVVDFYAQSASVSLRTIRASITETVQFSSRWYLCARKIPYALHPVSQKFPRRCLWNGCNVRLTDDGPLSSFRGRSSSASRTVVFKHIFWSRIWRQLYKIQSINGEDICNLHNPAPHLHSALEIKPLQSEHWSSAYCRQFPSTLGDGAQVTCDSRERHSVTCAEHDSEIESLRHGWDELVWN